MPRGGRRCRPRTPERHPAERHGCRRGAGSAPFGQPRRTRWCWHPHPETREHRRARRRPARRFFQMVTAPFGGPGQPPNRTVRPGGSRGGGPAPQNVRPGGSRGGRSAYPGPLPSRSWPGASTSRSSAAATSAAPRSPRRSSRTRSSGPGSPTGSRVTSAGTGSLARRRSRRLAGRGRSWPSTATSTPTSRGRSTTSCSPRTCSSPSTPATCGPCAGSPRPRAGAAAALVRPGGTCREPASPIRTTAGRRASPRCSR